MPEGNMKKPCPSIDECPCIGDAFEIKDEGGAIVGSGVAAKIFFSREFAVGVIVSDSGVDYKIPPGATIETSYTGRRHWG